MIDDLEDALFEEARRPARHRLVEAASIGAPLLALLCTGFACAGPARPAKGRLAVRSAEGLPWRAGPHRKHPSPPRNKFGLPSGELGNGSAYDRLRSPAPGKSSRQKTI